MLHLHAALAERERKVISERTIAALAAAKARGQYANGPIPQARALPWTMMAGTWSSDSCR